MRFTKSIFTAAVATVMLVASAAGALAAPASATTNVNVRSGPGTSFHVVSKLLRGQNVEVDGCQSGWCYISQRGVNGWVSAQYLNARAVRNRPNFYHNFGTIPNRPGITRPQPSRPSIQPSRPSYQPQPSRPSITQPSRPSYQPQPSRPSQPAPSRPGPSFPQPSFPGYGR